MRERVHYIDVCKGMMILMVIWQHAPVFAEWAGIESGELWIVGGGNLMVVLWLLYASILPAQRLYFQLQKTL